MPFPADISPILTALRMRATVLERWFTNDLSPVISKVDPAHLQGWRTELDSLIALLDDQISQASQDTSSIDFRERLLDAARNGRFDDLESIRLSQFKGAPIDSNFAGEFVTALIATRAQRALSVLLKYFSGIRKTGDWIVLARLVGLAASHWPTSSELRAIASDCLKRLYGGMREFDQILSLSRLNDPSEPIDRGMRRFQAYRRLLPGHVYRHVEWGKGTIIDTNFHRGRVIIDFPGRKGMQLRFTSIRGDLRYLSGPTESTRERRDGREPPSSSEVEELQDLVNRRIETLVTAIRWDLHARLPAPLSGGLLSSEKLTNELQRAMNAARDRGAMNTSKLSARLASSLADAETLLDERIEAWTALPPNTLKAIVLREGMFENDAGMEFNLRREILDPILRPLEQAWAEAVEESRSLGILLEKSIHNALARFEGLLNATVPQRHGAIRERVRNVASAVEGRARAYRRESDGICEKQFALLSRKAKRLAEEKLRRAYAQSARQQGPGMHKRINDILGGVAGRSGRRIYESLLEVFFEGYSTVQRSQMQNVALLVEEIENEATELLDLLFPQKASECRHYIRLVKEIPKP